MSGRRFSLALLCVFGFCALVAQGAMAQVGDKSVNTTAVTCVFEGGNEDFSDAHCDDYVGPGNGDYGHEPIANDTTTELDISNVGSIKINGTTAGVAGEITCSKAASVAGKSFLHNVETSGKHTVTGSVQINLSECVVLKPTKCIVTDILLTANVQGVEGLGPNNDTMGLEFVGTGENKTLAEIIFHHKPPEEKCSLDNKTKPWVLKGSAIATGTGDEANGNSGATWVFEDANEMETLEKGLKKASLTGEFTPRMAGGGDPIALTTTT